MDDPQSSNPLEPVFDAGSELLGKAIGAFLDPFKSGPESSDDEAHQEQDTQGQVNVYADGDEDSGDKDDGNDDDYYNDDVDGQSGEYIAAPLDQSPTQKEKKYYKFLTSDSRANADYSSPNSEHSSATISASLGRAAIVVILSGLTFLGIVVLVSPKPDNPPNVRSVVNASTYRGTINNKYKVEMNLGREGNNLSGTYVYLKYNIPIELRGTVDSANNVVIYGYDRRGTLIDIFNGTFSGNSISGTFTRQKDLKKMPFQLTR